MSLTQELYWLAKDLTPTEVLVATVVVGVIVYVARSAIYRFIVKLVRVVAIIATLAIGAWLLWWIFNHYGLDWPGLLAMGIVLLVAAIIISKLRGPTHAVQSATTVESAAQISCKRCGGKGQVWCPSCGNPDRPLWVNPYYTGGELVHVPPSRYCWRCNLGKGWVRCPDCDGTGWVRK